MVELRSGAALLTRGVSMALLLMCCANPEDLTGSRVMGSGGSTDSATGGSSSAHGGASATSGGASSASGSSSGGATTSAGATALAGASAKGGSSASGGAPSYGGATGSAGTTTGPSGTQLFLDNFDDGDYTGPAPDTWIPVDTNGTWSVQQEGSSDALTVTGSSKTMAVSGDVNWTNQNVQSKVMIISGTSTVAYLMGRWSDTKNFIVIEFRVGTTSSPKGDLKLRQNVAGSTSDLCRFKPTSALPNEWHTIGFSVNGAAGSTLTLYFDGQAVTTDQPCVLLDGAPNGGIAVGVQSGGAAFDDVSVTSP